MKVSSALILVLLALAGCGGSGVVSDSQTGTPMAAYGFNHEGEPFVAKIDLQGMQYQYGRFDPVAGREEPAGIFQISPLSNQAKTYSIAEHQGHLLALNSSHVVASIKVNNIGAPLPLAMPALFVIAPITNLSELAGTYAQKGYSAYVALRIDADGQGAITCESPTKPAVFPCPAAFSGKLQIKKLAYPYFRITLNTADVDLDGKRIYLQSEADIVFAKTPEGGVQMHMGAEQAKVCQAFGTQCDSYIYATARIATYVSLPHSTSATKWVGKWVFNREGGKGTVLTIQDNNTRSSLDPDVVLQTYIENPAWTGIDDPLQIEPTISKLPSLVTEDRLELSRPGSSWLTNLSFGLADENSGYGSSALFRETPVAREVLRVQGNGAALFELPNAIEWDERYLQQSETVQVLSVDAAGKLVENRQLGRFLDYTFEPFFKQLLLKAPLPPTDDAGNKLFVVVNVKLSEEGVRPVPRSFGLRLSQ
ncbi:MAG: hypothetical protein ACRCV9_05350 [Burkholderiaceae bacterium]